MRTAPRVLARATVGAAACAIALMVGGGARAGEPGASGLGVNVFGFSRHLDVSDRSTLREFNPGAGLQWRFSRSSRASLDGNVGVYQDSYGHANWHLSLGARVRLLGPLSAGAQLISAVSPSLNDGYPVLTPYPIATLDLPRFDLHLTYIPAVRSFNGLATIATFATLYPWGHGEAADGARSSDGLPDAAPDWQALEFTVNGLHGLQSFGQSGISWRHMFDDRHGLRLGVQLSGDVTKSGLADVSQPATGQYTGELRLQYLRRSQPRGRVRPYWAAGLANRFGADSFGTSLNLALRGHVGVEYELTRRLALAVETGLAASYQRDSDYDLPELERREFRVAAGDTRMALMVRRGHRAPNATAAGTATAAPAPTGPALMVLLGGNLTVAPLREGAVAWRSLDASGRGWRFVAIPLVDTERHYSTLDTYMLELRAEHMRHHVDADGFSDYWGFGPLVGYEYRHEVRRYDEDEERTYLYRSLSVGLGAVVGAEIPVTAGIRVLAEYAASLQWTRGTRNDGARQTRWRIQNDAVRLGLAVGLCGRPGPAPQDHGVPHHAPARKERS